MRHATVGQYISHGILSGTIATVPMTGMMELLRLLLLQSRSGTFPPRQVALGIMRQTALDSSLRPLGETGVQLVTAVSHFGFGGTAGGIYGALASRRAMRDARRGDSVKTNPQSYTGAAARGMIFGIMVWVGSYFGWLPTLGIFKPQGDYPIRKNLILALSHVVWGAFTGLLFHRWQQSLIAAPSPHVRSSDKNRALTAAGL